MSTYNYMACEDCKCRTSKVIAVERIVGSHIDNAEHLLEFLQKHRYHNLQFFSEYDDARYDYKCEEMK